MLALCLWVLQIQVYEQGLLKIPYSTFSRILEAEFQKLTPCLDIFAIFLSSSAGLLQVLKVKERKYVYHYTFEALMACLRIAENGTGDRHRDATRESEQFLYSKHFRAHLRPFTRASPGTPIYVNKRESFEEAKVYSAPLEIVKRGLRNAR